MDFDTRIWNGIFLLEIKLIYGNTNLGKEIRLQNMNTGYRIWL